MFIRKIKGKIKGIVKGIPIQGKRIINKNTLRMRGTEKSLSDFSQYFGILEK